MPDRLAEIPTVPYVAVIAAAGRGARMGGPKALLAVRWGDGTGELPLAIAHARAHLDDGAERVIVVTTADAARVLNRFAQRGLELVVSNAPPELGPAGSIRYALGVLPKGFAGWLMIEPVDMPASTSAIRRELFAGTTHTPTPSAVRPVYEGKRGHPVLVHRSVLDPMLAPVPPTLRDLLHGLGDFDPAHPEPGKVLDVAVVDDRAVTDFDVPEDVKNFYGHEARFFDDEEPSVG